MKEPKTEPYCNAEAMGELPDLAEIRKENDDHDHDHVPERKVLTLTDNFSDDECS